MKPIYIHSGMAGAPQYANANDNINAILEACLINGFNTKTATSASASGGVLTLNFAADPGFEALQTVEVAVSSVAMVNGQHRVVANANNQVTIAIAGLPDGAVGSSGAGITIKQAGAGWSKPFSASTKAVFRPPAGNRRYLRVVNAANVNLMMRGYENMSDVDTGAGEFPTVAQDGQGLAAYNASYSSAAGSPWFVIATDKWVQFSLANAITPDYPVGAPFFGDLSDPVQVNDNYSTLLLIFSSGFLPRSYTGLGGAVTANVEYGAAGAAWPSSIQEGLRLVPYLRVHQSGGEMRGVLPNAYKSVPIAPAGNFSNIYANVLGISGRAKPVGLNGAQSPLLVAIAVDEEAWA